MKKTTNILVSIILILVCAVLAYYFLLPKNSEESDTLKNEKKQSEVDKIKIIAVGDSLTAGYGLALEESYPMQLEKKLLENEYNVEIINAGISGETTAGLLERTEFIKSQNPDIILITIGGNDALRNLPVENTEENIRNIIQDFRQILPAEKIFLMRTRSPLNAGIAYASKFNAIYEKIEKEQEINLVPFVETEVFLNSSLMLEDRIHPNKQGYAFLIDKYIYRAIVKEL